MKLPLTLGLALVLAAGWLVAGPAQLGGGAAYVTTYGDSMQPSVDAGDLVLLRAAAEYRVGDVVAYRSGHLQTVILHRVVAMDGGRYVLQGDNNSWLDLEHPAASEILGRQWLHIPGGGRWLQRLTSPSALGAAAFLLLSGGAAAAHTRRRRRRDRRTVADHPAPRPRSVAALLSPSQSVAAGIAAVGLLGALLGGLAWTRPAQSLVAAEETATSTVEFTYNATVPPSAAYDDTTVTAPQAVFRNLTDSVDVEFRYEGQPGTVTVDAELATASGWRSTVRLADPVRVDGTEYADTITLELSELQARAEAAAAVIGLPAQQVTVAVVPRVSVGGDREFAPRLAFTLDDVALRLSGDAALTEEHSFPVTGTAPAPATLSLGGRDLPVTTARTISLLAVAVAVVLAAALAVGVRLTGPVAEPERIRRRHGQLLLPVAPIALPPGRPVVDVPDVGSLVKLAERYGLLVLHWSRSGVDTYVVQDADTTYRHRTPNGEPPPDTARNPEAADAAGHLS